MSAADGLGLAEVGSAVDRREGLWPHGQAATAALRVLEADGTGLAEVDTRLAEVARLFGLDDDERRLLRVVALPELHPAAHLLTGLLSGDGGPGRPTVALALELAGLPLAVGVERLGAGGVLVGTGLVEVVGDDAWPARRLRVPDQVTARLLGSSVAPAAVGAVLVVPVPADVDGAQGLAAALEAGERLVWVHAPGDAAGTALAAAACQALDVGCLVGDLARLPGPADAALVRRTVRDLLLEAGLDGSVLVLAGAQLAAGCLDELDRAVVPVVAVGSTPWDAHWAARLPVTLTAGRLTTAARAEQWEVVVGPQALTREVLALRMTPEQIVTVGRRARADAERAGRDVTPDDVRAAARRLGTSATGSARVRSGATPATLDDLVLPPHTRREVERLIGWVRDRDEVAALGDLRGKGGKGSGIAALFSGSPGTGKTLAAHVVADSLGVDLFQVDLAGVVDKYIGETEKNLERVFAQAESLNAVLFFDEADALFGSRKAVTDARDRYANQEVAYLLQRTEASEGITILATNLRGNLDPAFARRLHFMVHFPDPDEPTRVRLWQHLLAQLPTTDPADPVDVPLLAAAAEISGGDIRNIVLAAAFDAVADGRSVGMRDLTVSAEREMAKLGRRVPEGAWAAR